MIKTKHKKTITNLSYSQSIIPTQQQGPHLALEKMKCNTHMIINTQYSLTDKQLQHATASTAKQGKQICFITKLQKPYTCAFLTIK